MVTRDSPTKSIVIDTSLTGIGASDGVYAYGTQIASDNQIARSITELEAINILVALHTFADKLYEGQHVRVLSH